MLKVFSPVDTSFTSNGDAVIIPTLAVIHKVDNGDYYLELECSIEYSDYIKSNNIIVANTPQGEQPFRIGNTEVSGKKIIARCNHIFYDSLNYVIADSYVVDKTCEEALIHLNNATDNESPFAVSSDVSTVKSFRCVRKSLYEAIFTVIERWGGHLVRDGFNIAINNSIGEDNGVTIQYKKNLKEITVSYDWSEVCTKVLPVGTDGYLLDELYLYSDIQYDIPYTKTVSFEQDINPEDYPTDDAYKQALREDLIYQATEFLKISQYPAINYSMSANMEKITDVGDLVEVYDERIGVSVTASVLSFEYDSILGKYNNIEFGTPGASLEDLMSDISTEISTAVSESTKNLTVNLQSAIEVAEARIWQALGSSYCIFNGDTILILDRIPSEDAQNIIKIDNQGISITNGGVNGSYTTIWSIDGSFNFSGLNVLNFTADLIKGGIYKVGSYLNGYGEIKIYSEDNREIGSLSKDGLTLTASDGSKIVINPNDGIICKDKLNNTLFALEGDTIVIKKVKAAEEINLFDKASFLPIGNGIGLV